MLAATLSGASGHLVVPLAGALGLILVQKLAGLAVWMRRRPRASGRFLRLALGELLVSSLIAPIIMIRQTLAVVSVLAGQDCGWKPAGGRGGNDSMPWLEPAAGAMLLLAVLPGVSDAWQVALVLPIVLPLLLAPVIVQWIDGTPGSALRWPNAPRPVPVPVRNAPTR